MFKTAFMQVLEYYPIVVVYSYQVSLGSIRPSRNVNNSYY